MNADTSRQVAEAGTILRCLVGSGVHGLQGVELMETGRITLPVPEPDRTWIRDLRVGKHTMADALERAQECDRRIAELLVTSPLPEKPDYDAADKWLISAYQQAWSQG